MAAKRKRPRLRISGRYHVAAIYRPDGRRSNISFGPTDAHTEGEVYAAFGQWVDLFRRFPHKVLSYRNPYEAVKQLIDPASIVTVGELVDKYFAWAERTLRPVGENRAHDTVTRTRRIRRFLEGYRNWAIDDFGPDELRDVQEAMKNHTYQRGKSRARYTRRGINDNLKQIRAIWEWGVGREIVTVAQAKRLEEVKSLRMGQAPDPASRPRVTEAEFKKVIQAVNTVVADMLWLIWYTAMRPGEVCKMRPFDILRDDPDCWMYIPGRDKTPVGEHKTMRFGRVKIVPLASKPQRILARRITDFSSKDYVFKPAEAIGELQERRSRNRKTPMSCGNRPGTNRRSHPMIRPGDRYTTNALRNACKRGCARAGVEPFKPYDLRRSTATGTRSILGKEAAKLLLGHANMDTTDIYLLEEIQEAVKMAKLLDSKT